MITVTGHAQVLPSLRDQRRHWRSADGSWHDPVALLQDHLVAGKPINLFCWHCDLSLLTHNLFLPSNHHPQRAAFGKFPDLRMFALANVANVDTREALSKHFGALDAESLKNIASYLNLVPENLEAPFQWHRLDKEFLSELLVGN